MPDKIKMYLNLRKYVFHRCFPIGFDSKFKISLHHEHFPEVLEKYTRFPKLTLLFSIIYVRINGEV